MTGYLSSDHALSALFWIGGLGLLGGVMSAIMFPAWQSMLPELVPRENLLNAIALNSAQFQSARLLGPLVAAGLVLVGAGMGEIFLVNAASFLFVIAALWAIRPHPAGESVAPGSRAGAAREGAWRTLTAGLRYAVEHPYVGILILSTAVMTIFGLPYMMLLPAYTDKVLGGGAQETAWLMAANGLGAVVGSLVVAGLPKETRRERLIPFGLLVFASLLFVFSLSRTLAGLARDLGACRCGGADGELARQHEHPGERPSAAARPDHGAVHHVVHGTHADQLARVRPDREGHRAGARHHGRLDRARHLGAVPDCEALAARAHRCR